MKSVVSIIEGGYRILPATNALVALKTVDGHESVVVFSTAQLHELLELHPPTQAPLTDPATLEKSLGFSTLPDESETPVIRVTGEFGNELWSSIVGTFAKGRQGPVETAERGIVAFAIPERWAKQGYGVSVDAKRNDTVHQFFSKSQARKVVSRLSGLTDPTYEASIMSGIEASDLPEESADVPITIGGCVARLYRMAAQTLVFDAMAERYMMETRGESIH